MTALELIDDIFGRPQRGVVPSIRHITPDQLKYLRDLIERAGPAGAIRRGARGSLVWSPAGENDYVVTEDLQGNKHTLTRLSRVPSTDCGLLF